MTYRLESKQEKRMRRKRKIHRFKCLIIAAVVILIPILFIANKPRYADMKNGWQLILVNGKNYIPENYRTDLLKLSNGQSVDSRIYPDLQQMFDDARKDGLELFVRAGYRTEEQQQQLLDDKIEEYRDEYKLKITAKKLAEKYVAKPGTSEHELGLAVDINADNKKSSDAEVYKWLDNNSYKYGFIRRYPDDKKHITHITNEPWHFRYVGKKAASEMHKKGRCLEEYIAKLK